MQSVTPATPPFPGHYPPYRPAPDAWTPPPVRTPAPKAAPFRAKELIALAGLAILTDLAFWNGAEDTLGTGGFGFAVFFLTVPFGLLFAVRTARRSARLVVTGALLALVALRCFFDPTVGAVIAGLGLLLCFALGLRARRTFVPEVLASAFIGLAKVLGNVSAVMRGGRKLVLHTRVGRVSLLPIVVPLGLCIVFGGVFALANPVVAHGLGVAWTAIASVIALPSIGRIFMWLFALLGAASLLRPAVRFAKGADTETPSEDNAATPVALLIARNALFALNALFLLYNALDAAYLWSGAPPAGMQTRNYAHAGAFWLTIALVMLTGVIGVMFRGALAHDARATRARTLAYVWMAQGLVLALGTYRRIAIHVAWSGLSDLRIVGILGTTLVVVGVVLVAKKLRERRTFTWLVRRQLDAFALTLALYAVFPTHLVSARFNVARIESGEYRPVLHMFRQARDAESAAAVVPLLRHPDLRVRQGVAALLEVERSRLRTEVDHQTSWREHDVASRRTLAHLDAAEPEIASVLGEVDRDAAREVLLELSRVANERSLEELLTVPTAAEVHERNARSRNAY